MRDFAKMLVDYTESRFGMFVAGVAVGYWLRFFEAYSMLSGTIAIALLIAMLSWPLWRRT